MCFDAMVDDDEVDETEETLKQVVAQERHLRVALSLPSQCSHFSVLRNPMDVVLGGGMGDGL